MPLRTWSVRRLLVVWAAGLAVQAALLLAPVLLARRLVERDGPRLRREAAARDARWRADERADSVSLAEQRTAARAAGTYTVTARGDTLFPLVRVPSGRPDPARVAALARRAARTGQYVAVVFLGAIPFALVALTAAWLWARRRGGPGRVLGAA